MNTEINNDSLKIKYILGNYKELETYPDKDDAIFFLIDWARNKNNDKYEFRDEWLKSQMNSDKVYDIIKVLESEKIIKFSKSKDKIKYYKVIKNPLI
jgi:hypothetical protein